MAANIPTVTDPLLDEKTLEPRKKPIEDAGQAHAVAKRLFGDRSQSNETLGIARRKYDGEPPLDPKMLTRLAQFWRANFSVKSLSTAVTRFAQGFTAFDDSRRYLTASKLPETASAQIVPFVAPPGTAPAPVDFQGVTPGNIPIAPGLSITLPPPPAPIATPMEKSERFQRAITKTVRAWPGWRPTKNQIINDNSLYGFALVGWLDPIEWRPTAFTFDQCAVPIGSTHDVNDVKSVVFRKAFAIDEMIDFIKDREAAETAGWNVDNVVAAVNHAMPKDIRGKDGSQTLEYADAIREGNYARASSENSKVVDCYVVFYREYSGKVSQYIVLQSGGGEDADTEKDGDKSDRRELFYSEDRFERMGDVAAMFSLQWGDGKYYGSIGLGRTLIGLHVARDINWCTIMDMCVLNSMMRKRGDKANDPNKAAFRLQYPMIILDQEEANTMDPHKADVATLQAVDENLSGLIQQLSNTFLPTATTDGGEKATAREIIENARRVDATNGDLLARWYAQDCAMLETIQRRLCSRDNLKAAGDYLKLEESGKTLLSQDEWDFLKDSQDENATEGYVLRKIPAHLDADAVMCCVGMLRDGLTALDIYRLSRQPVAEPMGDTPAVLGQKAAGLLQLFRGDADVDQYELKRLFMDTTVPEWVERLMRPANSESTQLLEAQREQLKELAVMNGAGGGLGAPVPVSPNDNHVAHNGVMRDVYQANVTGGPEAMATNPNLLRTLAVSVDHYDTHIAERRKAGEKGQGIDADEAFGKQVRGQLGQAAQLAQRLQQQAQATAAALPQNPNALPAPQQEMPIAA